MTVRALLVSSGKARSTKGMADMLLKQVLGVCFKSSIMTLWDADTARTKHGHVADSTFDSFIKASVRADAVLASADLGSGEEVSGPAGGELGS